MRLNGCHNRKPFATWMAAQDGWQTTWMRNMVLIPVTGARECVYTTSDLGKKDKGCKACIWRKK